MLLCANIVIYYYFRLGVDLVGSSQELPDSSYTSYIHLHPFTPQMSRLSSTASWLPLYYEGSWLEVDLLRVYTVIGLMMLRTTVPHWYLTLYDLKVSTDGISYQYIDQNIPVEYLPNEDYTTYWFDNVTQARYYRIEPVTWVLKPSVKCDVIGNF